MKPGAVVIDLGAAPGGWSQVAADRVKAVDGKGRVVAADLTDIEPVPGVTFLQADITDAEAPGMLCDALAGAQADLVLSDMAASSTGHRQTDHLRVIALAEAALDIAEDLLKPGGVYLAKVLQGGAGQDLVTRLKQGFAKVQHIKPKASRQDSAEVLCAGDRVSRRLWVAACLFPSPFQGERAIEPPPPAGSQDCAFVRAAEAP